MKRLHLIIHGEVQGVFFRDHVHKAAGMLKLNGWVRNKSDGTVEVMAEGDEKNLKELLRQCEQGPTLSKVNKIDKKWEDSTGEFTEFQVRF